MLSVKYKIFNGDVEPIIETLYGFNSVGEVTNKNTENAQKLHRKHKLKSGMYIVKFEVSNQGEVKYTHTGALHLYQETQKEPNTLEEKIFKVCDTLYRGAKTTEPRTYNEQIVGVAVNSILEIIKDEKDEVANRIREELNL